MKPMIFLTVIAALAALVWTLGCKSRASQIAIVALVDGVCGDAAQFHFTQGLVNRNSSSSSGLSATGLSHGSRIN